MLCAKHNVAPCGRAELYSNVQLSNTLAQQGVGEHGLLVDK